MTSWCILRTSPGQTLNLRTALVEASIEAWTPIEVIVVRVGRSRSRVERELPIVSGIVFADYAQLGELASMSRSPALTYRVWDREQRRFVTKGYPPFTVFRDNGKYPRVADKALDPLRMAGNRRPKISRANVKPGDDVECDSAGFGGIGGSVTAIKGKWAWVLFAGLPIAVKIEARHLLPSKRAA